MQKKVKKKKKSIVTIWSENSSFRFRFWWMSGGSEPGVESEWPLGTCDNM